MSYSLIETDIAVSVLQNIRLVLITPKGSDVHRPEFGSDLYKYVDNPTTELLKGEMKAEVIDVVELWEPRATVVAVEITISSAAGITVYIEVDVDGQLIYENIKVA